MSAKCDYCDQPGIQLVGETNNILVCIDHAAKVDTPEESCVVCDVHSAQHGGLCCAHRYDEQPPCDSEMCRNGDDQGVCCNRHAVAPRRVVSLTVEVSEPVDSSPMEWAEVVASIMRRTFQGTTVRVERVTENDPQR